MELCYWLRSPGAACVGSDQKEEVGECFHEPDDDDDDDDDGDDDGDDDDEDDGDDDSDLRKQ